MDELSALKDEVLEDNEVCNQMNTGQKGIHTVSQTAQQFQFTQFVPQDCNGNMAALRAVKVPYHVTTDAVLQNATESQIKGRYIGFDILVLLLLKNHFTVCVTLECKTKPCSPHFFLIKALLFFRSRERKRCTCFQSKHHFIAPKRCYHRQFLFFLC
jgi:hypothetical protein